ncbi:MAG: hypothetical protein RLZZ136_123 [Pseudomonadota bacterium]
MEWHEAGGRCSRLYIFAFGFCIKVLTGKGVMALAGAPIFAFVALGLRTSRVLRFCDLAML